MKKNFKRVVSVILCLVILCCPFANVMQPAHANPGVVWAAGASVLEFMAFVLGLLGISFASKGAMTEASNQYLSSNPAINTKLNELLETAKSEVNGTHTLQIGVTLFLYMKNTVIPSVMEFFSRTKVEISIPNNDYINSTEYDSSRLLTVNFVNGVGIIPHSSSIAIYPENYSVPINFPTKTKNLYSYLNQITSDGQYYQLLSRVIYKNESILYSGYLYDKVIPYNNYTSIGTGFAVIPHDGIKYVVPFITALCAMPDGTVTSYAATIKETDYVYGFPLDTQAISTDYSKINYGHVIDYSKSEFMNALEKIYQAILGLGTAISIPWDGPVEDVEEGKKEAEDENAKPVPWDPNWALWWEQLGIKDLIETLTQNRTITESDVKMPELPVSIKDKFPFCVPFDVYYMIEKLNATSVAPSWNIPFKIQSLGINQNIPLDLSGWESVAAVCRWANVLLFILALVLLTRNIIRA